VNSVKFIDESSKLLISGGDDGICKIWDRRLLSENSSKPVGMFAGHTDGITHVSSQGDGLFFISNSKDQSIKLWDMRKFSSQNRKGSTSYSCKSELGLQVGECPSKIT